mmetsp:Transcript_137394/g.342694  ORF Transcript_137394/g.342694 Transcript_137394/m.342694 type:complete len:200 (+) Transcript_137394:254-853(+)
MPTVVLSVRPTGLVRTRPCQSPVPWVSAAWPPENSSAMRGQSAPAMPTPSAVSQADTGRSAASPDSECLCLAATMATAAASKAVAMAAPAAAAGAVAVGSACRLPTVPVCLRKRSERPVRTLTCAKESAAARLGGEDSSEEERQGHKRRWLFFAGLVLQVDFTAGDVLTPMKESVCITNGAYEFSSTDGQPVQSVPLAW